jgi:hypothetical protein
VAREGWGPPQRTRLLAANRVATCAAPQEPWSYGPLSTLETAMFTSFTSHLCKKLTAYKSQGRDA